MGRHTATMVAEPTTPPTQEPPARTGRHSGALRTVDAPAPVAARTDSPRRAAQAALRAAEARAAGAAFGVTAGSSPVTTVIAGGPQTVRHVAQSAAPSRRAAQAAAGSTVRRHRVGRVPRAATGTAAALAIVAMTTSTAGAAFLSPNEHGDDTNPDAPRANKLTPLADSATPTTVAAPASDVLPVTGVDEATLQAASNELVRADFLTTDGVGTLTDDQIAQINDARSRLGAAVTATGEIPVVAEAGRDSRTSRDGDRESQAETSSGTTTTDATAQAANAQDEAPSTEEISTLTAELRVILDGSQTNIAVQVTPAPSTPSEGGLGAEQIGSWDEQLDEWAGSTQGYANGKLPDSILCSPSFDTSARLRCDAAHQLEALNTAFHAAFGCDLSISDSYRSYTAQVATKAAKGYLAATPGTSNHGWGQAVDLDVTSYGSAAYEWLRDNAPDYGWDNPTWARPGGTKNEPWHWEYGTGA